MAHVEQRRFAARVECEYLVQTPDQIESAVTVFALHGYGMDAATMLRLVSLWFPHNVIVSLEAPHHFYRDLATRAVGYSWATHARSDASVRLHHEMLLYVMNALQTPADQRLLAGFSQPVGLNYRFAATYPDQVQGVIGVCGGIPGNWESGDYREASAALLHIARTEDEVYPIAVTRGYAERLRSRARKVEFLEFAGAHRFPSLAGPAVREWTERNFGC